MRGGRDGDILEGHHGNDTLIGGPGQDTLRGGHSKDVLRGCQSRDLLKGRAGQDFLSGGRSDDLLHGGRDQDIIFGGRGQDGGTTQDGTLIGGKGADQFILSPGEDSIRDFNVSEGDVIKIPDNINIQIAQKDDGLLLWDVYGRINTTLLSINYEDLL